MRTTQMFDDDGELAGVVATIKDITEEAAPAETRSDRRIAGSCARC